jgi:hypothetical protein
LRWSSITGGSIDHDDAAGDVGRRLNTQNRLRAIFQAKFIGSKTSLAMIAGFIMAIIRTTIVEMTRLQR